MIKRVFILKRIEGFCQKRNMLSLKIPQQYLDQRLDLFMKQNLAIHWNKIHKLLRKKKVYIKNQELKKQFKPDYKLQEKDELVYHESVIMNEKKEEFERKKENSILYRQQQGGLIKSYHQFKFIEDQLVYINEHVIVLNKRTNMTSQGGANDQNQYNVYPLVRNYLVFREVIDTKSELFKQKIKDKEIQEIVNQSILKQLKSYLNERKIFIIHRLDKNTTGNLILCRNKKTAKQLAYKFQSNSIKKQYLAIVKGVSSRFVDQLLVKELIDVGVEQGRSRTILSENKNCQTIYEVIQIHWIDSQYQTLESYELGLMDDIQIRELRDKVVQYEGREDGMFVSVLKVRIIKGKKHQIRAHMSQYLGTPILFDRLYGFYKENTDILNQMINSVYKDTSYHSFKEQVYWKFSNHNVVLKNGENCELQKEDELGLNQKNSIYKDYDEHCIQNQEIMTLHSFQLQFVQNNYTLFGKYDGTTDSEVCIKSKLPEYFVYLLYKMNNCEFERTEQLLIKMEQVFL